MEENLYNIGVEREGLRCDNNGKLSTKSHPEAFGDRVTNAFISTDWGEAQMELRTPVCKNTAECYEKLNEITNVVLCELNDQEDLLWPYSMQCILPKEEDFPWGNYGTHKEIYEYVDYLYKKYGYKMHCMSGIHVNISLNHILFNMIKAEYKNIPQNLDDAYFKIMRVFMKKAWMLMYFYGATPIKLDSEKTSKLSLRNTRGNGFSSTQKLEVDLSNKENYVKSIQKLIDQKVIRASDELYIPIRAKSENKEKLLEELKKDHVNHIEVRLCDINPFDKCGVSKEQMDILVLFLIKCLLEDEDKVKELSYKEVAENGLNKELLQKLMDEVESYKEINKNLGLDFENTIEKYLKDIKESKDTLAEKITNLTEKEGLLKAILKIANKYSEDAEEMRYKITGHPYLEASTQIVIKNAISRGIDYRIIDEKKSFVEFNNGKIKECIIQASKTSKDTYIFPFITDDKMYAKEIMMENGIDTPKCICINKDMPKEKIERIIKSIVGKKVVVKPKSTNYGDGITILDNPTSFEELSTAIEYAFTFDTDVLVEEYVKGNEYRFLVIDGKCIHVSWRRRTSVVGDGASSIKELIDKKVKSKAFVRFNRKIVVNQLMLDYLAEQGLSLDYIPAKDERIFLHKISNVSKGGEGVGVNEIMPDYFKKIAEKLVRAFNAKVCRS